MLKKRRVDEPAAEKGARGKEDIVDFPGGKGDGHVYYRHGTDNKRARPLFRPWFDRLKAAGKLVDLSGVQSATFLRHAEAQAVIQLSKAAGPIPESIELFSDRVTCGYACKPYLPDLFSVLGIKHVTVVWKNMQGPPLIWDAAAGWNR